MAKGYDQVAGVDFQYNYAPVVTDTTFKVLLAIWISKRYSARLLDVKTAFLYGVLEEELFLSIPEGYEEFLKEAFGEELKGKYLDLKKTIYGLVQAAREWWKKFIKTLKEKLGFKQYQSNNCLLIREDEAGFVAVRSATKRR